MEKIGNLIRSRRKANKLTLAALAQRAALDTSTLSRLETDKFNDIDYEILVAIARALSLPKEEFISVIREREITQQTSVSDSSSPVLMKQDVEIFLQAFLVSPELPSTLMAGLFNQLAEGQIREMESSKEIPKGVIEPYHFTAKQIEFSLIRLPLFNFEINFPSMSYSSVHFLYQYGGVITFNDVSEYILGLQRESGNFLTNGFHPFLAARLVEGVAFNIRLSTVKYLDQGLGYGEILGMYWDAIAFQLYFLNSLPFYADLRKVLSQRDILKQVKSFIRLCRWMQRQHQDDIEWLLKIRTFLQV